MKEMEENYNLMLKEEKRIEQEKNRKALEEMDKKFEVLQPISVSPFSNSAQENNVQIPFNEPKVELSSPPNSNFEQNLINFGGLFDNQKNSNPPSNNLEDFFNNSLPSSGDQSLQFDLEANEDENFVWHSFDQNSNLSASFNNLSFDNNF